MSSLHYCDWKKPPKSPYPLGTLVYCIHCFRTLGRETGATSREFLISRHSCVESRLAKRPAAPPPYN